MPAELIFLEVIRAASLINSKVIYLEIKAENHGRTAMYVQRR